MTRPMKQQRVGPASPLDQDTWQQILTAAKDLFFAKGYRGVSMKEIADAVQVMPSALYYHFPKGKEGLAGIEQILGTTQDLRERLNVLTASLLTLPIDEQFTMLLRDAREHIKDAENQRIILSLRDKIKQQVMSIFQAARDAGEIRTDIPVTELVSLYMGMLRESKNLQGSRQVSHLVTVLLDGIRSSAQPDQY